MRVETEMRRATQRRPVGAGRRQPKMAKLEDKAG